MIELVPQGDAHPAVRRVARCTVFAHNFCERIILKSGK